MKLHRFYVDTIVSNQNFASIPSADLLNQFRHVLRLVSGEKVIIFDDSGSEWTATIVSYENDRVNLSLDEKRENNVVAPRETYLFASIVKKDTFEWIAEKATELGVSHIIPIVSARSEKKAINSERLKKIIREAAEQSGRATIPVLYEAMDLTTALREFGNIQSIAWEPAGEKFLQNELAEIFGVYIGPEGGWTEDELEMFKEKGITVRSLGPQILRAETAAVAVLARLVF